MHLSFRLFQGLQFPKPFVGLQATSISVLLEGTLGLTYYYCDSYFIRLLLFFFLLLD